MYNLNPTELQLGFLKMLSGTKIKKEKDKFNYIYTSYPPYEVLQNDFITYEELKKLKKVEAVLEFYYNSERFKESLKFIMQFYDSPFEFYDELANYYYENNFFERKISSEEQYDILASFLKDVIYNKNSNSIKQEIKQLTDYDKFIQYLKFDFVNKFNTKRVWMPNYNSKWLKEKIDEKVHKMLEEIKDENIYKKYKFEMFEIDIKTGKEIQNLLVLRR